MAHQNEVNQVSPRTIAIKQSGLNLIIEITKDMDVRLVHFSSLPYDDSMLSARFKSQCRLVEVQASGYDHKSHHGRKHVGTMPGGDLKYLSHNQFQSTLGLKLEVVQGNDELKVVSHIQFYEEFPVICSWTEIENVGQKDIRIQSVSSFVLTGIDLGGPGDWDEKSLLNLAHNTWHGECQWKSMTMGDLGLTRVRTTVEASDECENDDFSEIASNNFSIKRILVSGCGTWPTEGYLTTGAYENKQAGTVLCWDIEHHGSWLAEISDVDNHLYLYLSGPDFLEHQWSKVLKPGQAFVSVPAAVCSMIGTHQDAFAAMTEYRRFIRRPNKDNVELPVIFNDYMNCLFGDPTTEKLLPLIRQAASIGSEIYCIDAGWYADDFWWDSVGYWEPSRKRFPGGFDEVLQAIRDNGMIPGLWLELESMGINCPIAKDWPDECFFMLHGQRVVYNSRYQLDWRHPLVIEHANSVIDRIVCDYGVGYIKMDYNVHFSPGTEVLSDSPGDGLLQHTQAYLDWLDDVFERYPDLIIENCGSGGLRMTTSLLRRHSIQSVTDQTDYRRMAVIASNAATAVTPEQSAIWSYPLKKASDDEIVFNMVNAILFRIHMSGKITDQSEKGFQLIQQGIDCYKKIRKDIPSSRPFWPLGLGDFSSPWLAFGLDCGNKVYIAVWRRECDENTCVIPLEKNLDKFTSANMIYPSETSYGANWAPIGQKLKVFLPRKYTAGVICLSHN